MHASYANAAVRALDTKLGMTVGVTDLRGSIHIESADVRQPPAIRPNFLATTEDQQCLINGMKIVRGIERDDEWLQFARENGQTIYHPIGTYRMGSDENAAVGPDLRVCGVAGLRVVDAPIAVIQQYIKQQQTPH